VPHFSSTADSIQPILPSLYTAASFIISAVTYLSEQDVKIRVSVFGKFVIFVRHSAANEGLVELFALTRDKRFSAQLYISEVHPQTAMKVPGREYTNRPGVLNLLCEMDSFDKDLVKPMDLFSEKCISSSSSSSSS
jgi:hypothetical protein